MLAVFARIEPALRKSITFDNDTAFAQHALLKTMWTIEEQAVVDLKPIAAPRAKALAVEVGAVPGSPNPTGSYRASSRLRRAEILRARKPVGLWTTKSVAHNQQQPQTI